MVQHLNEKEFEEVVINNEGVVLVDFWATWCGPCKMIAPIIEQLSEEMENVKVVKVDVDQNESLANKYEISSIPTLITFKNGNPVEKIIGFAPKDTLKNAIEKHI